MVVISHYLCRKNSLKNKKPDKIVWDENQEKYVAKLLPYGSELNGPIIEVPNVDLFKKKGVDKVSKQFNAELVDLKKKITRFVKEASDTQKVYSAKFKFEPIIGEVYFLYFIAYITLIAGFRNQLLSDGPASIRHTLIFWFSDNRLASTHPEEPPPTIK